MIAQILATEVRRDVTHRPTKQRHDMLIVAQHDVFDSAFWPTAAGAKIPDAFRLLQVVPSADGKQGVCLWDAPSLEALRELVDPAVGHLGRSEFFPVDEAHSVGLPSPRRDG